MKYTRYSKWFVARCYEARMTYEEFEPLARRLLGIDVPRGTYDMQRTYLQHRTPEQMGDDDTTTLGEVVLEPPR